MTTGHQAPADMLRAAREEMITRGLQYARVPASLVTPEIEQSWRRSISQGVDTTAEPIFSGHTDMEGALFDVSERVLDQWATHLEDSRMSLLIADRNGRIVSRRILDSRDNRALDRVNATEGYDFSEQTLGTNGLGTPIEARQAVFVRGSEHFNDALADLACAGAPIIHPITGRAIGSVSIASALDVSVSLMLAMARQAGQQITSGLESAAESRDLDLARAYRRLKSTRGAVLVMNAETVMTDIPALAHLDARSHALLWEELRRHRWVQDEALRLTLPLLGHETLVRRIRRDGGEDVFAIEFPARDASRQDQDTGVGLIPLLDPAPRPVYEEVARELDAAASEPGLIRVTGPAGVGKRHQSERWLRDRTGREPLEIPASDIDAALVIRALDEDRGVIVTGGAGISDWNRHLLEDLARTRLPEKARIVLTERPAGVLSSGPRVVEMPGLAEQHTAIPGLINSLAAQLYPGAPAPRFSPAALQRLLAWPWPRNVPELRNMIAGQAKIARGELIEVRDLPLAMRRSLEPSLSRYERSERETITTALRETGGNKSQAAQLLGIGRTTLYRKMRTLKIDAEEHATVDDGRTA
ncbi:sigma-54-dependent Fis family transcriptional regulator [Corynebacterium comes]|uniref:Transcriptional regulatory protein ZraR n=1 Tax=Corynebacterium comes TaxID=2675218 RepID=A0A6B8VWW7_9CORY|nr:helix-turn-helix domain-containing protein [Corynebacterium comes]QGU05834.1 Transcriptional regulatory protein ZraR [Corynebacterium comes]